MEERKGRSQLKEEEVIWAYRVLLGREPESENVLQQARTHNNLADLRNAIIGGQEFRVHGGAPLTNVPATAAPITVDHEIDRPTLDTIFTHIERNWKLLGEVEPHWSVLSNNRFCNSQIASTERAFYKTGAIDLQRLEAGLMRVGVHLEDLPVALEYGCGIGRFTEHLSHRVKQLISCDISASHLDYARRRGDQQGLTNVKYELARIPDLAMTKPFDLWYSYLVLQHNPPPIIANILKRVFKMLLPGGVAYFQTPTYAAQYRFSASEYMKKLDDTVPAKIEMHCLPQSAIFKIAKNSDCEALEVREDGAVGSPAFWVSNTFIFRKRT